MPACCASSTGSARTKTIARPVEDIPYPGASKLNTDWQFIRHLRDEGRKAAEAWLTPAAR